jgi:hypothetical protein
VTYSRAPRLTPADVRELYARYVTEGHSLATLAEKIWLDHGYRNVASCQASLGRFFKRRGLPIRPKGAARVASRKAGHRPSFTGYLTDDQVRAAHVLYERGLSLNDLGKLLYELYGYADYRTCADALSRAFQRLGLPARDRISASKLATRALATKRHQR